MGICLPNGIASDVATLQNLHCERNQVSVGDLIAAMANVPDREVRVQCVFVRKSGPETINQAL